MAQRDYAARSGAKKKKKQRKSNKSVLFMLAIMIVAAFAFGLKEKAPENMMQPQETVEKTQPKSVLPNRPEEVWSYIKALETRTVPIDDNPKSLDKNMRLTEEQRKILAAMEEEQKQAELAKTKAAEAQQTAQAATQQPVQAATTQATQQPQAQSKQQPQVVEAKKATTPKEEKKAEQTVKAEPQKKTETAQQTPTSNSSERKYGLQCGAFKNKAQAEGLQARLSLLGLPARVKESADWNRVVVGPAGDRNAAVKMQEKAKSVINCVVIAM